MQVNYYCSIDRARQALFGAVMVPLSLPLPQTLPLPQYRGTASGTCVSPGSWTAQCLAMAPHAVTSRRGTGGGCGCHATARHTARNGARRQGGQRRANQRYFQELAVVDQESQLYANDIGFLVRAPLSDTTGAEPVGAGRGWALTLSRPIDSLMADAMGREGGGRGDCE